MMFTDTLLYMDYYVVYKHVEYTETSRHWAYYLHALSTDNVLTQMGTHAE
jgi:hypothetical protein